MSPTPPSSSSATASPEENGQNYRVVRKRNRIPLSCGPCRNRKLKCNRTSPCENCIRRKDAQSCTYAATTTSRSRPKASSTVSGASDEMQSRIDRLEGLVLSLMTGAAANQGGDVNGRHSSTSSASTQSGEYEDDDLTHQKDSLSSVQNSTSVDNSEEEDPDEVEQVRSALGIMSVDKGKSFYRGETHWAAILAEITEVKKFFEDTKVRFETEMDKMKDSNFPSTLQTGFPFSATRPPTKQEILLFVPRKELVDLLVDAYFRNYDPVFHVLHRPTFNKQYNDFWRDPEQAPTLWLGLLMIVISVALRVYHYSGEEPEELLGKTLEMSFAFRGACEQCLLIGNYLGGSYVYTVQTLILLGTFSSQPNEKSELSWPFMGAAIRVAMLMGLHRDPKNFPSISPTDAEIRRRLWAMLTCMDINFSLQMGLPSMIREDECDTPPPTNLHDEDFGDHLANFPPARPLEELTGVSYMIHKMSMSHLHHRIMRQSNRPYQADRIMALENAIVHLHNGMPPFLRLRPLEESTGDPVWLIIHRITLDMMYQKAHIMLHRPFTSRSAKHPRYRHSRARCVEAAIKMLDLHATLVLGGETILRPTRWFLTTVRVHDFMHAAMIVCLHLSITTEESPGGGAWRECQDRQNMYATLERFRNLVAKGDTPDYDAKKAVYILNVMLEKLTGDDPNPYPLQQQPAHVHVPQVEVPMPAFYGDAGGMQPLEWDDWDEFMNGMNMDRTPGWGWPQIAGNSIGGYFAPKFEEEEGLGGMM